MSIEMANNIRRINRIMSDTINTIENSRNELLDIVDISRKEYEKTKEELKAIKIKAIEVIQEVDELEIEEKESRFRLAKVSKEFYRYDENDIKKAYEDANDLRIKLMLKRKEEKILVDQRKRLELGLKKTIMVLEKAENINKQISVATEYLKGNLDDILFTIDDLSKKQFLGIKIIEAQEEERQRLARDIHDGPAQSLANIIIKAELCERLLEVDLNKAKYELSNLRTVVRVTLKDIRKIIYDLRPMSLDDLGLGPTLDRYVCNFTKDTGIGVELNIIGELEDINSAIEIAIFRIAQEALSNIRKHSMAASAKIKVERTSTRINMTISDDGVGFDTEDKSKTIGMVTGGYGIISMKERVELLSGKLYIKSSPGFGTRIFLYIPLAEEDNYEQ